MGKRRPVRRAALVMGMAGALAFAVACSPTAPSAKRAAADGTKIDQFLLAPADAANFDPGTGTTVTAPISGGTVTLPYTDVLPLPDGPIGDPQKNYTFCFSQALTGSTWAVAQQESVMIEAARHPNVKVLTYNTNNDPLKQVADLDSCLAQKVDAFLIWPHSVEPQGRSCPPSRDLALETVVVKNGAPSKERRGGREKTEQRREGRASGEWACSGGGLGRWQEA